MGGYLPSDQKVKQLNSVRNQYKKRTGRSDLKDVKETGEYKSFTKKEKEKYDQMFGRDEKALKGLLNKNKKTLLGG